MRLPTFFTKVRQFAVGYRYCVVTLALLSASFLCALAQESQQHPPTHVQPSKAGDLVSTAGKSTFADASVAQAEGRALPHGYKRSSEGRVDDSAPQGFAYAVGWSSRLSSGWTSSGDLSIRSSDQRSGPGGSGPGADNQIE